MLTVYLIPQDLKQFVKIGQTATRSNIVEISLYLKKNRIAVQYNSISIIYFECSYVLLLDLPFKGLLRRRAAHSPWAKDGSSLATKAVPWHRRVFDIQRLISHLLSFIFYLLNFILSK